MPGKSIVPSLLKLLEPYLNAREQEWMRQPSGTRRPTLPSTSDGKVNVLALVRELGLKEHATQHFYDVDPKKDELRTLVNALAHRQGLKAIGARAGKGISLPEEDLAAKKLIQRQSADNKRLSERLIELEALVFRQSQEIRQLKAMLRVREETGLLIRSRPLRKT